MRILIIEDSDAIRQMIEALVIPLGHDVIAVPTGAKGIDAALSVAPDAILLDLHLPGSYDGFDVTKALRAHPVTEAVPIVVISGLSDTASQERALEAGATAYYTKPFSPMALLKELERLGAKNSTAIPSL
jgi:CheY-like chemotaxis protein